MVLNTWEQRMEMLESFRQSIICQFPETNTYNIFIYGSFLMDTYKPGISDIDLAIYADESGLYIQLEEACINFFRRVDHKLHTIWIQTDVLGAYIDLVPLRLNVCITNYFPVKLKEYKNLLSIHRMHDMFEKDYLRTRKKVLGIK